MVIVLRNLGAVSLISRNHSRLLFHGDLLAHIIARSAVEVVVGPLEELLFVVGAASLLVGHGEFGLGIQVCALLCHICVTS